VAREVFAHLAEGRSLKDALPAAGASPGGLSAEDVEKMVDRVLLANGDVVEEIRSGRDPKGKKIKFLTGLVMKEARGQADAAAVSGILERRLGEGR
jgi:aspartyl-tRNA(Asn)/glutamyl-tRNA(Gln) amidotransferase subunit B